MKQREEQVNVQQPSEDAEMKDLQEQPNEEIIDTTTAKEKPTPAKVATAEEALKTSQSRMFLDDVEYQSFVRRLAWSPDGNFLLAPAACYYDLQSQSHSRGSYTYTVYGFLKTGLG